MANQRKNVNVGVLGHVDCGKTSLCKALSTKSSTAAFDAHPQSQERGITLDLGFSTFILNDRFSITLVDCPGHASLIRTILGGVRIMDLMLLVVDINKGLQPQSAECLVLANILCPNLIVVLNKVDLLNSSARDAKIEKAKRLMKDTLSKTRFGDAPIVVSSTVDTSIGVTCIKDTIAEKLDGLMLQRDTSSPFIMAVDHCFVIKGAGSVCTGTVLQGSVKVGDPIEFPELQMSKKVKSMQIFREPVNEASAGDRVAVAVTGLDNKLIERGIICAPSVIPASSTAVVISIQRVPYYKGDVVSNKRFHISVGYSTVTALVHLFSAEGSHNTLDKSFHYTSEKALSKEDSKLPMTYFAILEFDKSVYILPNALVIGSNLQMSETTMCRLAFYGQVIESTSVKDCKSLYLPTFNIYHWKIKTGSTERVASSSVVIAKGFCQKQSNIDHLIGLKVVIKSEELPGNVSGRIESRFGQTDKVRISLDSELSEEQINFIKKRQCEVELKYKSYLFKDKSSGKKLVQ